MITKVFDTAIMLRFDKTKVATKRILWHKKKTIKIWNVDVDDIVISKIIETKGNSKYLIGYLDEVIRPLVLILPKITGYVKTFKQKNNKLISLRIDNEKLLRKYKTIWTKIEDLKNIELHALTVQDNRYIKTKIRTYGDKVYTNFRGLNVPEGGIECESFTVISTHSLLVYESKYYLQVHLANCISKIVNTQVVDYLGDSLFKCNKNYSLL